MEFIFPLHWKIITQNCMFASALIKQIRRSSSSWLLKQSSWNQFVFCRYLVQIKKKLVYYCRYRISWNWPSLWAHKKKISVLITYRNCSLALFRWLLLVTVLSMHKKHLVWWKFCLFIMDYASYFGVIMKWKAHSIKE